MSRWAPYVDAAPVRAHLLLLRQTGMGIGKIVRQSGISRSTVQRLLAAKPASDHRRPPRIRPDVASRLMAVTAASESSDPLIDAAATQQRFQELSEAGFGLRRDRPPDRARSRKPEPQRSPSIHRHRSNRDRH